MFSDFWRMKGGRGLSVREMREVRLDVEPKYITEDSKVRLYMSVVYCQREAADQKARGRVSRQRKMHRQKKMREIGRLLALCFAKLMISLSVTAAAGIWAIQKAYEDRGYQAVGGECLFIPLVFVLVYWLLGYVFEE